MKSKLTQNQILPWRFVTGNPSRRDFARHVKSLPKQYRKEAINQLASVAYPSKAWPSLAEKIDSLWSEKRIRTCTESSNVALSHAIDRVAMNRNCANSCLRLLKEAEADKEWSPHFWPTKTI